MPIELDELWVIQNASPALLAHEPTRGVRVCTGRRFRPRDAHREERAEVGRSRPSPRPDYFVTMWWLARRYVTLLEEAADEVTSRSPSFCKRLSLTARSLAPAATLGYAAAGPWVEERCARCLAGARQVKIAYPRCFATSLRCRLLLTTAKEQRLSQLIRARQADDDGTADAPATIPEQPFPPALMRCSAKSTHDPRSHTTLVGDQAI